MNTNQEAARTGQAAHTPTPYRANGFYITATEATVAQVDSSAILTEEQMRANQAFVVRACNSHAALVQALEDAEFLLRKAGQYPGPMRDSFRRSASDARDAIARAKEGQQ